MYFTEPSGRATPISLDSRNTTSSHAPLSLQQSSGRGHYMLLRKNRTIYQYLTNSSISIRRIEDSQALEKQHIPAALLEKKTKNPFDAQKRYHFRIPERENLTVQHKMTETPIDLTSKKKTSLWSCFQVCFPVIPQRPPASSSKSQKVVSKITTSSSGTFHHMGACSISSALLL